MHEPLKNPGIEPWKFAVMQQETTAYHSRHSRQSDIFLSKVRLLLLGSRDGAVGKALASHQCALGGFP